jgi:hypothetical protein
MNAQLWITPRLSLIDEAALQAWEEQWRPRSDRPGGWNWREQRLALRSTLNRFEVALWSGPVLCGLAIGKPSKGPSHLAVQLLEGNPAESHPLKGFVAECAVEAGISYGGAVSLSVILCARHNEREGAHYAEQSEEGIA